MKIRLRAALTSVAALTVGAALTGVSSSNAGAAVNPSKATSAAAFGGMAALVKAAQKEGTLNVITLPADWANYGNIIKDFSKKYGIKVNSENPDGTSADEITAVQTEKGQSRAPDVLDMGTSFAISAAQEGLLAPYKVQSWSQIPATAKDSNGDWFDDYGGYVAIGCNTTTVTNCPTSFKQMSTETGAEGYKIGLNNSPLTSNSALAAVEAAAVASGGSLNNVAPGVTFFANLNKNGAFVNTIADSATAESGTTNVIIWWDYLMANGGIDVPGWKIVIPSDVLLGEYYTQGINSSAPDPAAARLWEEFLYSPQGQNLWLAGGARPAELAAMTANKTVNTALEAKLPPLPSGQTAQYPTTAQITAAATTVNSTWATQVGASS
jgi:putative spermidine/putrescine transport system substrate-binding protein